MFSGLAVGVRDKLSDRRKKCLRPITESSHSRVHMVNDLTSGLRWLRSGYCLISGVFSATRCHEVTRCSLWKHRHATLEHFINLLSDISPGFQYPINPRKL